MEAAEVESGINAWETAYGMRVEILAAFAYLLGPISGQSEISNPKNTHSQARYSTHSVNLRNPQ